MPTCVTALAEVTVGVGETLVEDRWQDFFNENPFILNMAFGYPVIKVRDQASVGGRKLSGDGGSVAQIV